MLKVFRDNLKSLSWVLWAVIAVFVLLVFVDFGTSVPGRMSATAAAATVGDREVTYAEFQQQYRQLEAQFRQVYGESFTPELAEQLRLPIQALDQLVAKKILLSEAESLGLTVTDGEVRDEILEIDVFKDQSERFIGTEAYERLLRANGMTVAGFEAELREQIVLDKLNTIVASSLYVSDGDVESAYRDENESADIRFARLVPGRAGNAIDPTPEQLEEHFAANAESFRLPEQRVVTYLQVDANRLRQRLELSDEELRAYYDEHPDEFSQEEQVRARHILLKVDTRRSQEQAESLMADVRRRLDAGEDFAEIARELSDDPGSKDRGGDLGFFGRGRMIKEFEDAAFSASPGEMVGPVRTSFGVHLIEVQDYRPGGLLPYEEALPRIRNRMLTDRSQEEARQLAEALHTRIQEESIKEAAQLEALAEEDEAYFYRTTPAFGADDNVPGVGRSGNFSLTAFEMEAGAVSDPVALPRGYAILRLQEIVEPRLPELDEVEAQVRREVVEQLRLEWALEQLRTARAELDAGSSSFDEVAAELGIEVQESGEFRRGQAVGSLGRMPEINELALSLDEGQFGGPVANAQGPVLFEVTSRKRWDPEAFAEEAPLTRQRLEQAELGRLLGSIIDQRRLDLDVHYDRRLVESLNLETDPEAG